LYLIDIIIYCYSMYFLFQTGDGKVLPVNEMPLQLEMYNQAGPSMGICMPGIPGACGHGPDIKYNMMGGEDMVPYGLHNFPMDETYSGMYTFEGSQVPNIGGIMHSVVGGNQMGPRWQNGGSWYRSGRPHTGSNWQHGGSGGSVVHGGGFGTLPS
jgi:hypothetical protein